MASPQVAAECIKSAFRDEEGEDAKIGWLLVADFMYVVRRFMTQ